MGQHCNEAGLCLIRESEGLRLKAYRDSGGVLTIGYGHTGPDVTPDTVIDEETAERLLAQDVANKAEAPVNRYVTVDLNENQFSALCSFTFNLGSGNLRASTLLNLVNRKRFIEASQEFQRWNRAAGKVLDGLTARREKERALFMLQALVVNRG